MGDKSRMGRPQKYGILTKATISIDESVLLAAKARAAAENVSLSSVIYDYLKEWSKDFAGNGALTIASPVGAGEAPLSTP